MESFNENNVQGNTEIIENQLSNGRINNAFNNEEPNENRNNYGTNGTVSSVFSLNTKSEINHNASEQNVFQSNSRLEIQDKKSDPEEIIPGSPDDPYKRFRWVKQICLIIVWICIGLSGEIVGPTLPDLVDRLGVDYEKISRAMSGKSIGLMLGSLTGGFAHEKFYQHTDLILALGLFLTAFSTILTPFSVTLAMAGIAFGMTGFGEGIINTGGNTMVMHLWGTKATSQMHALHFGFGIGAVVAPQIARPFLSESVQNETADNLLPNETTSEPIIIEESHIEIPYAIVGTIIALVGISVVVFYIKGLPEGFPKRQNVTRFKEIVSPGSCTGGRVIFGAQIFACLFLYFLQTIGGARTYGKFLFSYAREREPPFSNTQASNLQSLFWLSFTIGRLCGTLIAKVVPLRWMIIGDIIGHMITAIILSIFADDNDIILWVFTAFTGLFLSVTFPNGMSWANLHLTMNSVGVMVLMVGGSCGGFIYQMVTGTLFNRNPHNMMYVMIFFSAVLGISYLLMEMCLKFCSGVSNKVDIEEEKGESDL